MRCGSVDFQNCLFVYVRDPSHLKGKDERECFCLAPVVKSIQRHAVYHDVEDGHEIVDISLLVVIVDGRGNLAKHFR